MVLTDARPRPTRVRDACVPSVSILNRLTTLSSWPKTGRPTKSTSSIRSSSMVPSTVRSGRARARQRPVEGDVDRHRSVLHRRIDAGDVSGDDAVAGVDGCRLVDLDVLGLRLRDAQLGLQPPSESPTRARLVPVVMRWPSSSGTCCRTPGIPARTRRSGHLLLSQLVQRPQAVDLGPARPQAAPRRWRWPSAGVPARSGTGCRTPARAACDFCSSSDETRPCTKSCSSASACSRAVLSCASTVASVACWFRNLPLHLDLPVAVARQRRVQVEAAPPARSAPAPDCPARRSRCRE